MITFKIAGKTAVGRLDRQKFAVPGEPVTENILNNIAALHPVINGGCPDPDYELFLNVAQEWPFLELVSRDQPPPRIDGVIY
jgi:hypothetical protein